MNMKFDERLESILKNFATINQSIEFKASDLLRTGSLDRTVIAEATLPYEFPGPACVYDLNRFLATLSLFDDPDVEFGDKAFTIKQGPRRAKYAYADVEMITKPKDKRPQIVDPIFEVALKWDDINTVLKAAGVMRHPNIAFVGDGKACRMQAMDKTRPDNDPYSIVVGETPDTFQIILDVNSMKLIPDDYEVQVTNVMAGFKSSDMSYFMAIDKDSSYKKAED